MGLADLLGMIQPQGSLAAAAPRGLQFNIPQPAPQAAPQAGGYGHGFGGLLDRLGDALLVANGGQPMHYQRAQQEAQRQALSGFLTNSDQAIAALMQVDPVSGIDLYKAAHPASEKTMEQKVYEYEQSLDPSQRPAFEKSIALTHPGMMTPYSMPEQGGTIQTPGSSGPAPGQVVNGFRFKGGHPNDPSAWEPASGGGATASTPSPTFR